MTRLETLIVLAHHLERAADYLMDLDGPHSPEAETVARLFHETKDRVHGLETVARIERLARAEQDRYSPEAILSDINDGMALGRCGL